MIESVNSVLVNASLSRGSAVQDSQAAKVNLEAPSVPKAPYISPYVSLNAGTNKAVLQIRDSETGDVLNQFPSESRIKAIQNEQVLREGQAARQEILTASPSVSNGQQQTSELFAPVSSGFDAGTIATLQESQGVSTSDIQLATVAFSAGAASTASAPVTTSVSVTA